MIVERIEVSNFRTLAAASLDLGGLTYLVGRNGAGKSTFLTALAVFFKQIPIGGPDDFTGRNAAGAIEISLTFGGLGPLAVAEFRRYVRDDQLRVTKRIEFEDGKLTESYHGLCHAFPGFRAVRDATGQARRTAYNEIREELALPRVQTAAEVEPHLQAWEDSNEGRLEWIDDGGQFFGYSNVGTGKLTKYIDFVLVPAVRDASDDAGEGRDSALRRLVDIVVRRSADLSTPMSQLRRTVSDEYARLLDDPQLSLAPLSNRITSAIARFAPGASVVVRWDDPGEPRLADPAASARIVDDGFEGSINTKGHGLQRAYIMASLQALAEVEMNQSETAGGENIPECGLLLAVEEPELYQHPAQARQIARTFANLVTTPGGRVQVVACTHSPLFLDVRSFDNIRVVRKQRDGGGPPRTSVSRATLDSVAARLGAAFADGRRFTGAGLRPGLVSLLNPYVSEAFFADFVVLVEGEEDKALLDGALALSGASERLRQWALCVVPVGGKKKLDKMQAILTELSIPHYTTFDRDDERREPAGEVERWNRVLQRLAGIDDPDPMPATYAGPRTAVFAPKIGEVVRTELGDELWRRLTEEVCGEFGLPVREGETKNPEIVGAMLARAAREGRESPSLTRWAQAVSDAVDAAFP
ncbi:MAG: ATP-dependent nuclease [Candidatus Limnocylindrales bacterium]